MAINWVEGVLERSEAKLGDRLVLIVLAESADRETGECYPGIATLCRLTKLSERAVQVSLNRLVRSGEITIEHNASRYRTNIFRMARHLDSRQTPQNLHPAESAPPQDLRGYPADSAPMTPQNLHPDPAESAPKPLEEPLDRTVIDTNTSTSNGSLSESARVNAPKAKRKTRLADDWFPTDANLLYAQNQGMDHAEIQKQVDLFRDHWIANGGVKLDWDATWRNWIRRAPEFSRSPGRANGRNGKVDMFAVAERLRQEYGR